MQAIKEHVTSSDFTSDHGVDFLQFKNSLFLSYLIELTNNIRTELLSNPPSDSSVRRFTVMKVVLDKSRGLEKKLRYSIEKLLSSGTTSTSFVADLEDALRFRPDTSALGDDDEELSIGDSGEIEKDSIDGNLEDSSMDANLEAARATISESRRNTTSNPRAKVCDNNDGDNENDDGIYRAPRLAAVPYNLDQTDRKSEKEKRQLRRMRTSELAQALRSQFGDGPEQEDIHGGTEMGRQREAAKRFERQQAEKTQYEEGAMVRLTVTRKEKQERKRLLREESSNLTAIADLGNIVRDAALVGDPDGKYRTNDGDRIVGRDQGKHTGKRKGRLDDELLGDGVTKGGRKSQQLQARNSLQAALFGTITSSKKSKQSRKRR